jgi:hypothetical protein
VKEEARAEKGIAAFTFSSSLSSFSFSLFMWTSGKGGDIADAADVGEEEGAEAASFERARDDFICAKRFAKAKPSSKSSDIRKEEEGYAEE